MQPRRVHEIDLLRFLAALSVVFYHYAFRGFAADGRSEMPYPWLEPVAKYGSLGVELFFMISGFVILMTASRGDLRTFTASRIARLYPAFWVCCTVTFLTILVLGDGRYAATLPQFLVNLSMLSGFVGIKPIDGVYWSLFVEIQFYAMVAALVALGQIHRAQAWLVAWLLATIALELYPVGPLRRLLLTPYAPWFIAGAFCYLVWKSGPTATRLASIAACFALVLYQSLQGLAQFSERFGSALEPWVVIALVAVMFAAMLLVAFGRTGWLGRTPWTVPGAITYPLYLLHQYVGFMMFNALYPAIDVHVLFWGTIVAMLVASYVIHVHVERPLAPLLARSTERVWDTLSLAAHTLLRTLPPRPTPHG